MQQCDIERSLIEQPEQSARAHGRAAGTSQRHAPIPMPTPARWGPRPEQPSGEALELTLIDNGTPASVARHIVDSLRRLVRGNV